MSTYRETLKACADDATMRFAPKVQRECEAIPKDPDALIKEAADELPAD